MTDIVVDKDEGEVATITLNRPAQRNSWNMETVDTLTRMIEGLALDDAIRALIFTGAGTAFSAGGDLNWMTSVLEDPDTAGRESALKIYHLLETIDRFPRPVIARVNGAAFGGGFGLICVADIAIASTRATFGLSEVRLGIVPGSISPFVLRRLGAATTRSYCLTGACITAQDALHIGLVQRIVEPELLDATVAEVIADILRSSPHALAATKRLFRELDASPARDWRQIGVDAITVAWKDPDAKEGISAFLEKRRPAWSTG